MTWQGRGNRLNVRQRRDRILAVLYAAERPLATDEVTAAIRALYALPDCGSGGPLHVELDDWNIEADVWHPYVGDWPFEVVAVAQRVCDLMNPLTIEQRAAVMALWEGWIGKGTP